MSWGFWALINWRAKSIQHHHPPALGCFSSISAQILNWQSEVRGFFGRRVMSHFLPHNSAKTKNNLPYFIFIALNQTYLSENMHVCMQDCHKNTCGWFLSKINSPDFLVRIKKYIYILLLPFVAEWPALWLKTAARNLRLNFPQHQPLKGCQ